MVDRADPTGAVWAFTEHEHRELVHGIDRIHDLACQIGAWISPDLSARVTDVLDWLDRELGAHIAWEEAWLYPEIDVRAGTPWATRSARFDHGQIRDMVVRLRGDDRLLLGAGARERVPELRCHLFALEALLRAHIDREERYLIPLLAEDRSPAPSVAPALGPPRSG